ncbi:MAG TPA: SDR family NAD(P)-dependent oxidoreductase [Streptosporangiaceae bacterium]|nr:SDR family NAD(P)-dependent oxidoreductase [Streptosporangiaceae bacterium]
MTTRGGRAGQVTLVTGGSAGLGRAIAGALAADGSDVVLASRSPARCEQAALLLTDPQSSYLTGAVLPVDGGWTAH